MTIIINISKVNIYQQYVCEILNTSTTKPADSVTERFIRSPTKFKLEVILAENESDSRNTYNIFSII